MGSRDLSLISHTKTSEKVNIDSEVGFSFSRNAIKTFKDNPIWLILQMELEERWFSQYYTASLRGNVTTSVIAAGKSGLRALSQRFGRGIWRSRLFCGSCELQLSYCYQSWQILVLLSFLDNHRWRLVKAILRKKWNKFVKFRNFNRQITSA